MTVDFFFFEVFWLCTNLGYLGDLGRVPYGFADYLRFVCHTVQDFRRHMYKFP